MARRVTATTARRRPWSSLVGYRPSALRHDVPAGLALTALLVPQGMAYATLAGLPPVTGLYSTITALVAYALVGPSRTLVLGPDSSVSPLIFATLAPLVVTDDPGRAVALAGVLAILVGLLEIVLGLARFGFVASLLSKPVQVGYLNGIALVVIVSQVPKLLGAPADGSSFLGEMGDVLGAIDEVHLPTLLVGLLTLVILVLTTRAPVAVPGVLVAVVTAIVVVAAFGLADDGVAVVGDLPQGLPRPELPWTGWGDVGELAVAAVGIVMVSLADTIAVSTSFASRRHEHVDPDREILAVGVGNVACGFFQGFAVSASSTRTAVAEESGSTSQVTGLVGALAVALLLVAAPGLLADLPTSALAAVVMVAAGRLADVPSLLRLVRVRPSAAALSIITTLGVVLLGVLPGIGLAVVLSILVFFRGHWMPQDQVLGRVAGERGWHDVAANPAATTLPGVVIYRFEAPLFFANVGRFAERVREVVDTADPPCRHLVLQCEAVTDVDVTAAEVLVALDRDLEAAGVRLAFAELRDRQREVLEAFAADHGVARGWTFHRSVKEALEAVTGRRYDDLGLDDGPAETA